MEWVLRLQIRQNVYGQNKVYAPAPVISVRCCCEQHKLDMANYLPYSADVRNSNVGFLRLISSQSCTAQYDSLAGSFHISPDNFFAQLSAL